jgi:hypothetical protein
MRATLLTPTIEVKAKHLMVTTSDTNITYCIPIQSICHISARDLSLINGKKIVYNPAGDKTTCKEVIITCANQDVFIIISYDTNLTLFTDIVSKFV